MKTKLLLYCTKAKPYLIHESGCYDSEDMCCDYNCFSVVDRQELYNQDISLDETYNGKIVAECDFEVEEIYLANDNYECWLETKTLNEEQLVEKSCLKLDELYDYLEPHNGYAIHIKNLHIFDKPKELSECYTKQCQYGKCSTCKYGKNEIRCATIDTPITKAPQNMMRVWLYENGKWVMYILISIQPQWMCLILNHIKDVEVRRVVLKEMLKNE